MPCRACTHPPTRTHPRRPPCKPHPRADDAQGSIGFILNRGSHLALSDVAASSKGAVARVADVFGSQRLRVGGPVHLETLTVLHGYSGCAGAQKVIDVSAGSWAGEAAQWVVP